MVARDRNSASNGTTRVRVKIDGGAFAVSERVITHAQTIKLTGKNESTLAKLKTVNTRHSYRGIPDPVVADCSELVGITRNVHRPTTVVKPHVVGYCKF